jgi:signal transduction histidine kinase
METLAMKRERVGAALVPSERLAALLALSAALYEFDSSQAIEAAEEALEVAVSTGDTGGRAWALHNRGWAYSSMGRIEEALEDQLSARAQFELEGDMLGVANSLMAIGDLYGDAGDTSTALEYLERARAPLKLSEDDLATGLHLNLTGIALSRVDRHREALGIFEQAETVYTRIGDEIRIGTAHINQVYELLELARRAGLSEKSALIERADFLATDVVARGNGLGDAGRHTRAYGKSLRAQIKQLADDVPGALADALEAEAEATAAGLDQLAIEIAMDRVEWLTDSERIVDADTMVEAVLSRSRTLDMRWAVARASRLKATIQEKADDPSSALTTFREFHELDRALHNADSERIARLTATRFQVETARQETELAQLRISELEGLDQDKREFLASVSHELRTPLAAVVGFATELSQSWDAFPAEEARALVSLIAAQSADISSIVEDLLTVTRLESGTMGIFPATVAVKRHLADMVEATGRDAARTIAWEGDTTVWADPTRLRQIVRNLITNAIRYGGSEIRVIAADGPVASIEVRDSGGPIPETRVDTMFEPFVHEDDNARTPNSVGLGLAVARSLARVMDGDLVYVYDGESVFRLTLPHPPG